MVFSSVVFLYAFLPGFLLLYFLTPPRGRNALLLLGGVFFYTWGEQILVLVMLFSTTVDYVCARLIYQDFGRPDPPMPEGERTPRQKAALIVSLTANLGLLGIFKYFNFAIDNYNAVMEALGWSGAAWQDVMRITLPLGISFYTFQSMSYTIDCYRGQIRPARSFVDFACFVTMFPQLVAGPIVRYRDVAEELRTRRTAWSDFAVGVRRFIIGLGKKMLLANAFAGPVDAIFALPADHITTALAWTGAVLFTLQLYYDFAGYSDMAIGMGRMFGFHFPENFNYPYISRSALEFWRRWHMTLSTFLRDYVFVALGGYRLGRSRAVTNLFVTFLLCGIWHGAAWNFVLFGLVMGCFVTFEMVINARKRPFFQGLGGHLYLLAILFPNMVIFRSPSLSTIGAFLTAMAGFDHPVAWAPAASIFVNYEVRAALVAGLVGAVPVVPWGVARFRQWTESGAGRPRAAAWTWAGEVATVGFLACVLLLCSMKLAAGTYNPFIYFRF